MPQFIYEQMYEQIPILKIRCSFFKICVYTVV